jgi:hypothetical protein
MPLDEGRVKERRKVLGMGFAIRHYLHRVDANAAMELQRVA